MGTYGFDTHVTVPTKTDGFGTFCLFETAEVEFEILVVEVNRRNSWEGHDNGLRIERS